VSRAVRIALISGALVASSRPAPADVFNNALFVEGRTGTVEIIKGPSARARISWSVPALDTGGRRWQLRVGRRALTCGSDADLLAGASTTFSALRGEYSLDLSGPDVPAGTDLFVRACLPLGGGGHHETNQVLVRVVTLSAVSGPIVAPLPGTPQITGFFGPTPVRPGYWMGVSGRSFGDRPGRLLLQLGPSTYSLAVSAANWRPNAIAGRLGGEISGVRDGSAALVVERADGARSSGWHVAFVATREVRVVPGGEMRIDSCSDAADFNTCDAAVYSGAPSLEGFHGSYVTTGEGGTDQYFIALANGWRLHDLELAFGEIDLPTPTWNLRGGGPTSPHIQIHWENPRGVNVNHHYGFRVYVEGPIGVPYR
jgi:hypothetical protein